MARPLGTEDDACPERSSSDIVAEEAEAAKVQAFQASHGAARRKGVSAAPVSQDRLNEWQGPPHFPKSEEERLRVRAAIQESAQFEVLFSHLDDHSLDLLVGAFSVREIQEGETVIQQGDDGDYFYIVESGVYEIFVQRDPGRPPDHVFTVTQRGSFGELALMYNVPRAASVICAQAGFLWALERDCFQMMLVTSENSRLNQYSSFLEQVQVLNSLNSYELAKLSDLLSLELFEDGEDILTQGEAGDAVYFLYEGECRAYIEGSQGQIEVRHYRQRGEYFGEIALLQNELRRATIRACGGGCMLLKLRREDLDLSVGSLQERIEGLRAGYPSYETFLAPS